MTPKDLNDLATAAAERASAAPDGATRWQYEKLAWAYGQMARRAASEAAEWGQAADKESFPGK